MLASSSANMHVDRWPYLLTTCPTPFHSSYHGNEQPNLLSNLLQSRINNRLVVSPRTIPCMGPQEPWPWYRFSDPPRMRALTRRCVIRAPGMGAKAWDTARKRTRMLRLGLLVSYSVVSSIMVEQFVFWGGNNALGQPTGLHQLATTRKR